MTAGVKPAVVAPLTMAVVDTLAFTAALTTAAVGAPERTAAATTADPGTPAFTAALTTASHRNASIHELLNFCVNFCLRHIGSKGPGWHSGLLALILREGHIWCNAN